MPFLLLRRAALWQGGSLQGSVELASFGGEGEMPGEGDIMLPNFLARFNFSPVATRSRVGVSSAQCRL